MTFRRCNSLRAGLLIGALALLGGCGGGSGTGLPPHPAPTSSAASLPAQQTQTASVSSSAATTIQFNAIDPGISGSWTYPAAARTSSGLATNATLVFESRIPGNVPVPQATNTRRPQSLGATVTPLVYILTQFDSGVSYQATPALTFTFPSGTLSGYAYLVMYNEAQPSAGWVTISGPVLATGTSLTIPSQDAPTFSLDGKPTLYVYAVVENGTPLPTPSATPTATPSASASPASNDPGNIVTNGDFSTGDLSGWYVCYASHAQLSAPVNPMPTPAGTGTPGPATVAGAPRPAASYAPIATGLGVQTTDATVQQTTPTGATAGMADFALVGHSDYPYTNGGLSGICQDVTIPQNAPTLSFSLYEGGNDDWENADDEADVFPPGAFTMIDGAGIASASGTALYAQNNCWNNLYLISQSAVAPGGGGSARANVCGIDSSKWPGGLWNARTFDLRGFAGQQATIMLGVWQEATSAEVGASAFYTYAYFGNVKLEATTIPGVGTLSTSPAALSFNGPTSQSVVLTETGYTGTVRITAGDSTIISAPTFVNMTNGSGSFVVTPLDPGHTQITLEDQAGKTTTLPIDVTFTKGIIQ